MEMICALLHFTLMWGFIQNIMSFLSHDWKRDLSLEKLNMTGVPAFKTSTNSLLECGFLCSKNASCVMFSYIEVDQICAGFQSFAAKTNSSSLVVAMPSPIFHKGDPIYTSFDSMTLLITEQKTTYTEAREICSRRGGRLLVMDTEKKRNDTLAIIGDETRMFWIGLSDAVTEGIWMWDNGLPFSNINDFWVYLNNKNFDDEGNSLEAHCAVYRPHDNFIGDRSCNRTCSFLCEKNVYH